MSYRFTAKADRAEILIYEDIGGGPFGGATAKQVMADLKSAGRVPLEVRINSGGGEVFEGMAIYNALKRHKARKVVHVDGIAASIASLVAMAGDEIRMAQGAMMMIHEPHGLVLGTAGDMRSQAGLLDTIRDQMVNIYDARTKAGPAPIAALMAAETWFTAAEAIEKGFADSMSTAPALAAHVDVTKFKNAPAELVARLAKPRALAAAWRRRLDRQASQLRTLEL